MKESGTSHVLGEVKRLTRKILLMSWKYLLAELINRTRGNSLLALTRFRGGWTSLRTFFCKQFTNKRRGRWMDVVGPWGEMPGWWPQRSNHSQNQQYFLHHQPLKMHQQAQGCFKISRDTQEAARLIKWPSPTKANVSEDACGPSPSRHWEAAQSEWKLIPFPHQKDVVAQSQTVLLDWKLVRL